MTLLACCFLLIGLVTALWLRFSFQASLLELGKPQSPGRRQDVVSLVVPMRNEERNVDCCLSSVRAQDYPQLQVIAVDDNSTDGTFAALARWKSQWPELEIVRLGERPPGWAGKTHPAHRGAEAARGEWLLFLDADVELAPQAISMAVAAAESRGWPMVSLMGRLKIGSFWEAVLQLYMWALFVAMRVELPRSALVGAFVLIRSSVYWETGGYASIPGAVTSDVALADLLVGRGIEPRVRLCPEAYACRMYESLREIWQGCSRMLAGGTGFRGSVIAACGLFILALDIAPIATLLWLALSHADLETRGWTLGAAAALALLMRWVAYQRILARMGAPAWAFLAKPLSDFAALALLADAARQTSVGYVTWKGRRYSKALVRKQGVRAAPAAPPGAEGVCSSAANPSITVVAIPRDPDWAAAEAPPVPPAMLTMAQKDPAVEFLVVSAFRPAAGAGELSNLCLLQVPSPDRYPRRRLGLEQARGEVIAFVDADCAYSEDWLGTLRESFSDPAVQIVAGRTCYAGEGTLAKAGSIRDWGAMADQRSRVRQFPENNFAARRQLLERYGFGDGFRDWGGAFAFALLAASDGIEIRFEPRMTCQAPSPYSTWSTMRDRLAARHALMAELVARDLRSLDFRSLTARLIGRFLPSFVWLSTALAAVRAYRPARAALGIRGVQRLTVPLALAFLADVDWLLAQWAILRPSWLARKARELGCNLSAEVDVEPAHPLLSRISQITWALAVRLRTPLPAQPREAGKAASLAASRPS